METKIFGVVLPIDVAQKARIVAAQEGKSRSRLMRDLLENYLKSLDHPVCLVLHERQSPPPEESIKQ